MADHLAPERPGPNGRLPHGTPSAILNHLARGQVLCGPCEAAREQTDAAVEAVMAEVWPSLTNEHHQPTN